MRTAYDRAAKENCDVVVMPELATTGYSPEDLLLRPDVQTRFTLATNAFRDEIANRGKGPVIVFGTPRMVNAADDGTFAQGLESRTTLDLGIQALANCAMVINPETHETHEIYKVHLPNWGLFDEPRIFASATQFSEPIEIAGTSTGVVICRDIWKEEMVAHMASNGAQLIIVPNASPYANARHAERIKALQHYARTYSIAIAYVNMVECCDEAVFEGGSFVFDSLGNLVAETQRFREDFICVDIEIDDGSGTINQEGVGNSVDLSGSLTHDEFYPDEAYQAIVLSIREFINSIRKNAQVSVGLSGGIDSALIATLAVDALGPDRVEGVLMPSKFTSEQSISDATELAKNLGIDFRTISIEKMHEAAINEFGLEAMPGIVSENMQSRLRGVVLMMLSNSEGLLPLATSNKSESAVGYCTLYGDTVGAFSPIKDVYKSQVYKLCNWRNNTDIYSVTHPIPESIIVRAPSAELRDFQTDEEALLPYDILDGILQRYIDYDLSIDSIVGDGFNRDDVLRITDLVNASEFKRKQTPVGPRLTRKNFGKGRRIPISAHW